ncbi:hypothetical protein [Sphingobacterium multivorum]|uniref:hypothetical protein n=1 Tax=Sphingobacterium TaxID=28453 RepID=UPI00289EFB44|nr:hypothetical protein [Sphingobacterium multivorum]
MSNNQNNFNVSQEFEIIPHQKGKAYPIGVKEWDFIKNKVKEIKIEVNNFIQIAYLLLGASVSCLITIFATEFKTDSSKYLVYSIFGITLVCGLLSLYFAKEKHKQESAKPNEIINQMELIESRFANKGS